MAVDLKQLGKLLALTRSSEPQEAQRAEEVFTNLFFKWCDEQGLEEQVGFARVGDATDLNKAFLEVVSSVTSARVLQLNAFDLCLVGKLPECKAVVWWFENMLPEVATTARRSANTDQDAFQLGALRGIADELSIGASPHPAKTVVATAVAPLDTPPPTEPAAEGIAAPSEPVPVKIPTPKEQGAMRDGFAFGRKLAVRALAKCPHRLR